MRTPFALLAAVAAAPLFAADPKPVYEQSFASPDCVKDFVVTAPGEWKYEKDGAGGYLELAYDRKAKPAYETKHRSPFHIALIGDKVMGDFTLDLEMASTVPVYGHQDLCLFFGVEGPDKYYYTHIAKAADPRAHNVFIVNDAPRTNIAKETTKGVEWGESQWHKVRLVREAASGKIEVYFDDMSKPIMRAEDKTFPKGYVGFGSFDDTGRFRNVSLRGTVVETKRAPFFQPLGK